MELISTLQARFQPGSSSVLEQVPFRNCGLWRENHTGTAFLVEQLAMEELCWSRLVLKVMEKIHAEMWEKCEDEGEAERNS